MNISYDSYKLFYYVAKYGSITQATRALLLNQPNVTRAIKNLETTLGCELFVRTSKGVRLTAEGERLFAHIEIAFEHFKLGEEELLMAKNMQFGSISIGATEISLRCYLLPILREYRKKYPNIRIKFFNMNTPQAVAAVKEELVDIAFATTPIPPGAELETEPLMPFRELLACGNVLHEQIKDTPLSLEDLTRFPLISLGRQTATYTMYNELFSQNGLAFSPDIEAATADEILPMIKHDLGMGFVPESLLQEYADNSSIYVHEVKDFFPTRQICALTKKGKILGLPAQQLKNMLRRPPSLRSPS